MTANFLGAELVLDETRAVSCVRLKSVSGCDEQARRRRSRGKTQQAPKDPRLSPSIITHNQKQWPSYNRLNFTQFLHFCLRKSPVKSSITAQDRQLVPLNVMLVMIQYHKSAVAIYHKIRTKTTESESSTLLRYIQVFIAAIKPQLCVAGLYFGLFLVFVSGGRYNIN